MIYITIISENSHTKDNFDCVKHAIKTTSTNKKTYIFNCKKDDNLNRIIFNSKILKSKKIQI